MSTEAYPYPILGLSNDYLDAGFQVAFSFPEGDLEPGDLLKVRFRFQLSDDAILNLINEKVAGFGFEIFCPGTSRRKALITAQAGTLELSTSEYIGRIIFSPRVFVLKSYEGFRSVNFHPEFGDKGFDIAPGDLLAATDDESLYLDFKKMKFESLLVVRRMSELKPFQYEFQLEGEYIIIGMGDKFYDFFIEARSDPEVTPYLIMSIYKDCMVAALDELTRGGEEVESAWARGLEDKLEEKGLALPQQASFDELNKIAQNLMEDLGIKRAISQ